MQGEASQSATILLVGAAVMALCGLALLYVAWRARSRGAASTSWPTVRARILTAELKRVKHSFLPVITYQYAVDGKSYTGSRVVFRSSHGNEAEGKRLIEAYPVNSDRNVHYNPANPADAVLEPGVQGGMGMIIFALAVVAVAAAFFVWYVRVAMAA